MTELERATLPATSMGQGANLAPLPVRLVAKLVDAVLFVPAFIVAVVATTVSLGAALVSVPVVADAKSRLSDALGPVAVSGGAGAVAVVAWVVAGGVTLYQWWLLSSHGQTIGKRLCGIHIVDLEGRPAGFFRALLLRNWIFAWGLTLLGGVLSAVFAPAATLLFALDWMLAFGEERRCLHDLFAGTRVAWVRRFEVRTGRVAVALGAVVVVGGAVAWAAGWLAPVERLLQATTTGAPSSARPSIAEPRPTMPSVATPPATSATPTAPLPPPSVDAPPEPGTAPKTADVEPTPAAEPTYFRYVDAQGVTHVVEGLDQVPQRYRAAAVPMAQ